MTNFPNQIDSFDIKSPQEVIKSEHMNSVQEAIVAIEVFTKDLESELDAHLGQTIDVHQASSIQIVSSLALISGTHPILATDLQTALEQIKAAIELVDETNNDTTAFIVHLNTNIELAHQGELPGSRIVDGTISESKLDFLIVSEAELLAHTSLDKSTAHPGTIEGSDIADGSIPLSKLDTNIATQNELDTHLLDTTSHEASTIVVAPSIKGSNVQSSLQQISDDFDSHVIQESGTHGIDVLQGGSGYILTTENNNFVGRLDQQRIENKVLVSDLEGTKLILFTEAVEELEKEVFCHPTFTTGSSQFIIRKPSGSKTTNTITLSGVQILIPVVNISRFNLGDNIRIRLAPTYDPGDDFTGVISNVIGSSLQVDFSSNVSITADSFITNETIKNPLFEVSADGLVIANSLEVQESQIAPNLILTGNLQVDGDTILGSINNLVQINGSVDITENVNIDKSLSIDQGLSANQLIITTDSTIGGDLAVSGNLTCGSLATISGLVVDNNIVCDGYGIFQQGITASQINTTSGIYNGVDIELLKSDFDRHQTPTEAHLADIPTLGFKHHTNQLGYSSLRDINPEETIYGIYGISDRTYLISDLPLGSTQVEVSRLGIFEVGDQVIVGDGYYGFEHKEIVDIEKYDIDGYLLDIPIFHFDSPTTNQYALAKQGRIVKKISYNNSNLNSLTNLLDSLGLQFLDHTRGIAPFTNHKAEQIITDPFSFSSSLYSDGYNVQQVLNEFGLDIYHHLDGYDGYSFPHNAKDIGFSNLINLGKKIKITSGATLGSTSIILDNAQSIVLGSGVEIIDGYQQIIQSVIVSSIVGNQVGFTPSLSQSYIDPFLVNYEIYTVQDAIEALQTSIDLNGHISDPFAAHNASAIEVTEPGFPTTDLGTVLKLVVGSTWESGVDKTLEEHLYDPEAHDAIDIEFDGYSLGLGSYTLPADNTQEAIEYCYRELHEHIDQAIGVHSGDSISITPPEYTNIVSDNIQEFIDDYVNPGDLVEQKTTLYNNQSTSIPIAGLSFDDSLIRSVHIEYSIIRDHGTTELACVGTMRALNKSSGWQLDIDYFGDDCEVDLTINGLGQIQYQTSNLSGSITKSEITYRARTTTK